MSKKSVILIGEDDKGLNQLIARILKRNDYTVISAYSGKEIIQKIKKETNVIMLLDYLLPDMNSEQIITKLNKLNIDVPYIIVTGRGDEQTAVRMMKMGAQDYVIKSPSFMDILPEIVNRVQKKIEIEERLKQSENLMQTYKKETMEGFYLFDNNLNLLDINKAGLKFITKNTKLDNLINKNIIDVFPGIEKTTEYKWFLKVITSGKAYEGEWNIPRIFNNKQIRIHLFKVNEGIGATINDISERKNFEKKIITSLKEKELLLQEIHHRVKNNLQIIISLLKIKSREIKDERACEVFQECQNRIYIISVIHQLLYSSDDFARVDMKLFLNNLISYMNSSYRIQDKKISVNINIDQIFLDINSAIPCGMIMNELLSNSFKYAFTELKNGIIDIEFKKKNNNYRLVIKDNGKGINKKINLEKSESLGLSLLYLMSDQLGGNVKLETVNGTKATINFPVSL